MRSEKLHRKDSREQREKKMIDIKEELKKIEKEIDALHLKLSNPNHLSRTTYVIIGCLSLFIIIAYVLYTLSL